MIAYDKNRIDMADKWNLGTSRTELHYQYPARRHSINWKFRPAEFDAANVFFHQLTAAASTTVHAIRIVHNWLHPESEQLHYL